MTTETTFCKFCGRAATALCDWKVAAHQSGTCDAPCCDDHAKRVAHGRKVLCPDHQKQYDVWKKRHPVPQGSLNFKEAA